MKESKQFGAQRRASEAKAVEIALSNLARNCGFTDVTRLVWTAETGLFKEIAAYFEPKIIEETELQLTVAPDGTASLCCAKKGKALKSIPAKLKNVRLEGTQAHIAGTLGDYTVHLGSASRRTAR